MMDRLSSLFSHIPAEVFDHLHRPLGSYSTEGLCILGCRASTQAVKLRTGPHGNAYTILGTAQLNTAES